MPKNHIYINQSLEPGITIQLDKKASHHLTNVLRMREGDEITLFNGDGRRYRSQFKLQGRNTSAFVEDASNTDPEPVVRVNLIQGVSRGDRMDWALQKAVELGVNKIVPVYCERSMKALDSKRLSKKLLHWHGVVISACEQSGRCYIPKLSDPTSLQNYLTTHDKSSTSFVLHPESDTSLNSRLSTDTKELSVLIGPEGGLTENEISLAESALFTSAHLGPRVLRTETAGVTALTIIQAKIGDLK